jgi:hypothetical protein
MISFSRVKLLHFSRSESDLNTSSFTEVVRIPGKGASEFWKWTPHQKRLHIFLEQNAETGILKFKTKD